VFEDSASPASSIALQIGVQLVGAVFLAGLVVAQSAYGFAGQGSASRLLYAMGRDFLRCRPRAGLLPDVLAAAVVGLPLNAAPALLSQSSARERCPSPMRCTREQFHVSRLNRERRVINLDPSDQREGGVWSLSKQQLFMDSLVNGYDIPKIYMHQLDRDETGYEYSVVDGKQRISTVLAFLAGDLAFADDFRFSGPECEDPLRRGTSTAICLKRPGSSLRVQPRCCVNSCGRFGRNRGTFFNIKQWRKTECRREWKCFGREMAALVRELAKGDFFKESAIF
jgi:hypothetical protein